MAKCSELTREEFQQFKKIKTCHNPLLGSYTLYGRRSGKNRFVGKHLTREFTSTRQNPVPCYRGEHEPLFFFELEGESLDGIFHHKTEAVDSKSTGSELVCWMTRFKDFERNLEAVLQLGLRLESQGTSELLLSCFRVTKQKLVYHYDSWLRPSSEVVRENIQELEKYYFGTSNLYEIKQGLSLTVNRKTVLFRLAFMVLHLGTRELGLRLYEFGEYCLNSSNLSKRLEVFRVKYPRLFSKVSRILEGDVDRLDDLERTDSFSTIQLVENNHKLFEGLSLTEDSFLNRTANLSDKDIYSAKKNITPFSGKKPATSQKMERSRGKSREKENRSEVKQLAKRHLDLNDSREIRQRLPHHVSLCNLREAMHSFDLDSAEESINLYVLLRIAEEDLTSSYQLKMVSLLRSTYLQVGWKRRIYTNQSVYVGEFSGDNREGKGFYLFESGDAYCGGWKHNKMHGFGKYLYRNGELYEGQLSEGMKHGHGRNEYLSGNCYEGSWVANKKEGLGTIRESNGQTFIGMFYGGRREAEGIYLSPNGDVRDGVFEADTLNESYFAKHPNRILEIQCLSPPQANQKQKYKVVETVSEDGNYRGETLNSKREGYGILETPTQVYEGYWKNGKKHGKGCLKSSNFTIQGIWEEDFIVEYTPTS